MFSSRAMFYSLVIMLLSCLAVDAKPKILCLHGGGGSPSGLKGALSDLEAALPEFKFVYAQGPYGSSSEALWIKDSPGGKEEPTTDPNWSNESVEELNELRESDGPFYAILGYSQGAAYVPIYLSKVPNGTFQMAITFCGYLSTVHEGLMGVLDNKSPFGNIPSLAWMGKQDELIINPMTKAMAAKFTNPVIIKSQNGEHYPPGDSDNTFDQVVNFIRDGDNSTPAPAPGSPTKSPTVDETKPPTPDKTKAPSPDNSFCTKKQRFVFTVEIATDSKASKETRYYIQQQKKGKFKNVKKVKKLPNNEKYSKNFCLKKSKCYRFKIVDTKGGFDGKDNYWKVSKDGDFLDYGYMEKSPEMVKFGKCKKKS